MTMKTQVPASSPIPRDDAERKLAAGDLRERLARISAQGTERARHLNLLPGDAVRLIHEDREERNAGERQSF